MWWYLKWGIWDIIRVRWGHGGGSSGLDQCPSGKRCQGTHCLPVSVSLFPGGTWEEGSHLQAWKKAFTRTWFSWHCDLRLPIFKSVSNKRLLFKAPRANESGWLHPEVPPSVWSLYLTCRLSLSAGLGTPHTVMSQLHLGLPFPCPSISFHSENVGFSWSTYAPLCLHKDANFCLFEPAFQMVLSLEVMTKNRSPRTNFISFG